MKTTIYIYIVNQYNEQNFMMNIMSFELMFDIYWELVIVMDLIDLDF